MAEITADASTRPTEEDLEGHLIRVFGDDGSAVPTSLEDNDGGDDRHPG